MAAPVYADLVDYREWSHDPEALMSDRLLARASSVVDELLIGAVYAVDEGERPTDTAVAQALSDATCAQAEFFNTRGDTTGAGTVTQYDSVGIGSLNLSGRSSATAITHKTLSGVEVAPGVINALRIGGLLPISVIVHG